MRTNTTRAMIVGLSVLAAGLLSACSTEPTAAEDTSATTSSAPPSTSAGESQSEPESPDTTPSEGGGEGTGNGEGSGEAVDEGSGVDCGPVQGTNGQVGVFADDTSAGTVGCTEAINVITEYYADSPTKGEGTAYALTVDGWYCLTDSGAQGSGAVGCEKDGLTFHTQA
jgi:hypothetical protein